MAKVKSPKEVKVDLGKVEEKPSRTMDQIQQEYAANAAKLGQLSYQVYILGKDIELLNQAMRNLNLEAAELKGKEAAAAKEA